MTDEHTEAVARAIIASKGTNPDMCVAGSGLGAGGVIEQCSQRAWELEVDQARAAIKAHEKSLAKAGLGIRPRKPTEEMICAAYGVDGKRVIWYTMFDAYKPDG